MTETKTGISVDPVDELNLAVQKFHDAVDAAQAAGWKVTVTALGDNSNSTTIRVTVNRRLERESK